MARKTIRRSQSEDFEIVDDDGKVGTVRIKPSGISWKPKGKQKWYNLPVEQFADLAEAHGKIQSK